MNFALIAIGIICCLFVIDLRRLRRSIDHGTIADFSSWTFLTKGLADRLRVTLRGRIEESPQRLLHTHIQLPALEWWKQQFVTQSIPFSAEQFLSLLSTVLKNILSAREAAALKKQLHSQKIDIISSIAFNDRFARDLRSIATPEIWNSQQVIYLESADKPSLLVDLSAYGYGSSIIFPLNDSENPEINSLLWCGLTTRLSGSRYENAALESCAAQIVPLYRMLKDLLSLSSRVREVETINHEKSEFIAHMSHDIRSPLNNVKSILTVLKLETEKADHIELIDTAVRNCQNLGEIVEDLLDYSKHCVGKLTAHKESINIANLAHEVLESFKVTARLKGLVLRGEGLDQRALVIADRRQLKRVLTNLLSNALKYTSYGSVILSIEESYDFSHWILTIRDTGIGMSSSEVEQLFTPFVRFNNSVEGAGLGLAVSKILVELNRGALEVSSKVGEGSELRIVLHSALENHSFADTVPAAYADETPFNDPLLSVLLVDDDLDLLNSLGKALEVSGFRVIKALTVKDAMSILNFDPPDAMITDHQMPEGGGCKLIDYIAQTAPQVRTCLLSGGSYSGKMTKGRIDKIFQKPIEIADLIIWLREPLQNKKVA